MENDKQPEAIRGLEHEFPDENAIPREELISTIRELTAKQINNKARAEKDVAQAKQVGIDSVLKTIIVYLDEFEQAEQHGDLEGKDSVKSTIAALKSDLTRHGLRRVGDVGERFNADLHNALNTTPSPDVVYPTINQVVRAGWVADSRLLRAAEVTLWMPVQDLNKQDDTVIDEEPTTDQESD